MTHRFAQLAAALPFALIACGPMDESMDENPQLAETLDYLPIEGTDYGQAGDWEQDNVSGNCNNAYVLSFNVDATDEINRLGDVDCFKFNRPAGTVVRFQALGADCTLHTKVSTVYQRVTS